MDRTLVRTSKDLRCFLAAAAIVQDYANQIWQQAAQRLRKLDVEFTIEIADDGLLFFATLFPKMATLTQALEEPKREDWECVLDFRCPHDLMPLGVRTQKSMVETMGVAVGASPSSLPNLIFLSARTGQGAVDILLDEDLPAVELAQFVANNWPWVSIERQCFSDLRPANLFAALERGKLLVGKESGATYLAAAMGMSVLEVSTGIWPSWWLGKYNAKHVRLPATASAEMIWLLMEEMWPSISNTNSLIGTSTAPPASTVAAVAAK